MASEAGLTVGGLISILSEHDPDQLVLVLSTCECCTFTQALKSDGVKRVSATWIDHTRDESDGESVFLGSAWWAASLDHLGTEATDAETSG